MRKENVRYDMRNIRMIWYYKCLNDDDHDNDIAVDERLW